MIRDEDGQRRALITSAPAWCGCYITPLARHAAASLQAAYGRPSLVPGSSIYNRTIDDAPTMTAAKREARFGGSDSPRALGRASRIVWLTWASMCR